MQVPFCHPQGFIADLNVETSLYLKIVVGHYTVQLDK